MLNKIIKFSIENKLIITLLTLGLIVGGLYSLKDLPIDATPDITNNQVQVITTSPSLAAQEVERLITYPIEQAMSTIPEKEEIRSISRFGISVVTIVFKDAADIYWARQQVSEKLNEARNNIPADVASPEIAPISTGLGEIYQYVIHAKTGYEKKYDARELRGIQDWVLRRQLLGIPGVADVNSFGGLLKQYEIGLDPDKLRSYNISITDVFKALKDNNRNAGGAYIDKKPTAYFIRTEGLIENVDDINKIVVKNTDGGPPLLIRDLATVKIGNAIRYGALTRASDKSQGEAVGGIVMMLKGANAKQVVEAVKTKISRIQKTLPEGVSIEAFLDRSALVDRTISTVARNLIEGALIVIFVLVLFLGNLRAGIIVASVIPLAMLFAIAMMRSFGVSGNLMSLGAIDFGLIVDGAIIVVEACMHHFAKVGGPHLSQEQINMEVYRSSTKIRSAAAFGEIIILIVYLPILALQGIEGKMFRPMAQTVAFAILGAFMLSLTYVPMISSVLLGRDLAGKKNISERFMNYLYKQYHQIIIAALRRKLMITITAIGLLFISVILFFRMGAEFIPTLEEGDLAVETRLLTGSSLSQTIDKVNQASSILLKNFPEVKEVVGKIGAPEIPTDPMPMEACDLTIMLKDKDEWTSANSREELTNKMSEALKLIPGVSFGFSQPIQLRSNELISGVRQDIGIKIFGDDIETLSKLSAAVARIAGSVAGAKDLYVEQIEGLPQIVVQINRDKIAQYGLSVEDVNIAVNAAFAGQAAGLIYEGEQRYDMVLRLSQQNRKSIDDVKGIFISSSTGLQIPLDQLANIIYKPGPNQIQREDTRRRIVVGLNVRGRDIQSVVNEIQDKIGKNIKLPTGYYVNYGGQFENLKAATSRLLLAVPLALALILVLLYLTFRSVKYSILIFTAIPMAAIGGILSLILRDMPFSISAGVGFIALFGVAVLNGIVLITEFNRLKKEGSLSIDDIVIQGTTTRLRPVLMTAAVASMGFLPMALSNAAGAEVQRPLATVVIGGLVSSTLLTLIVLPILYTYVEQWRHRGRNFRQMRAMFLVCMGLLLTNTIKAQQGQQKMSMDQAVHIALQNNQNIRAAQLEITRQQTLRAASIDPGKTSVELQYGQINSSQRDNNISISQNIPFPGVFRGKAQLAGAHVRAAQTELSVQNNELRYRVRVAYTQLSYFLALQSFYKQQDSIFSDFHKAARLRYQTGESTLLEATSAETQRNDVRNQQRQNLADIKSWQAALKRLLNISAEILPGEGDFINVELTNISTDSTLSNNPLMARQHQELEIAGKIVQLERALAAPDFSIGYFNQSILDSEDARGPGNNGSRGQRFQGVQAAIAIPLFFKPFSSRIKAAKIEKDIAQARLKAVNNNLLGEHAQAYQELNKNTQSLSYYHDDALPNAALILKQAQVAFQNGEIGYVEYLQALRTSSEIRLSYLKAINQYKLSSYQINYLTGI